MDNGARKPGFHPAHWPDLFLLPLLLPGVLLHAGNQVHAGISVSSSCILVLLGTVPPLELLVSNPRCVLSEVLRTWSDKQEASHCISPALVQKTSAVPAAQDWL